MARSWAAEAPYRASIAPLVHPFSAIRSGSLAPFISASWVEVWRNRPDKNLLLEAAQAVWSPEYSRPDEGSAVNTPALSLVEESYSDAGRKPRARLIWSPWPVRWFARRSSHASSE